jgi:hypothetical protein
VYPFVGEEIQSINQETHTVTSMFVTENQTDEICRKLSYEIQIHFPSMRRGTSIFCPMLCLVKISFSYIYYVTGTASSTASRHQ